MNKATVAVIGGGPFGLASLKNLREVGFEVTVFEKRDTIGGIWAFSNDPNVTSCLPSTVSNVTKYRSCFTDFPAADGNAPAYLTAQQVYEYLNSYAEHFNLFPHIKLNTAVQRVVRNEDDTKWCVTTLGSKGIMSLEFDKIVFCQGLIRFPYVPEIEGREKYEGRIIHSQAFKRPEDFDGKKVVILGLGNTAADTAVELVGHAERIYLSHRNGANIFKRGTLGKPFDMSVSRRFDEIKHLMTRFTPRLFHWLVNCQIQNLIARTFTLDPAWRIQPSPSITTHQPTINDHIIDHLANGTVTSVHGIRRFLSTTTLELLDGTHLSADTVILCTGYEARFDLTPDYNPTTAPETVDFVKKTGSDCPPLARLYQNVFPPAHADSIAYLNHFALTEGAIPMGDLASMAIARIWTAQFPLPSLRAMNAAIDAHHGWVATLAKADTVHLGIVDEGPWLRFMNAAAGTGLNEMLGYGFRGWWYWLHDMRFCNLLMGGVMSVHVFRLFDGGRRKWDGARAAIVRANENERELMAREREKQEAKSLG